VPLRSGEIWGFSREVSIGCCPFGQDWEADVANQTATKETEWTITIMLDLPVIVERILPKACYRAQQEARGCLHPCNASAARRQRHHHERAYWAQHE
jgi:hypothetical protein